MCGKFEVKAPAKKLKKRFGLKLSPPTASALVMNPTDRVLAIDGHSGHARGRLLKWGLNVNWDTKPLINARAETLNDKATFRPLLERRCLVPASAYFEWQLSEGGIKQKMRIHPEGEELFAMAGLIGTDGDSVTLVTCAPAPSVSHIHNRMPVILRLHDESAWIAADAPFSTVAEHLCPHPDALSVENVDDRPALL